MPLHDPTNDSFLKLADGLRELEVVIGEKDDCRFDRG